MKGMTRRELLAGLAGGVAAVSLPAITACVPEKRAMASKYKNSDFYNDKGEFNADAAKDAYIELMKAHNWPIPPGFRENENFWATDFNLGEFTSVGLGGIFWHNDEVQGYMAHEIFLLSNQMIVEHWHVQAGKIKPKMEVWQTRHGMVYIGGEGEATELPEAFPKSQLSFLAAQNVRTIMPGEVKGLSKPLEKHWMLAGPQGAVASEYATFHTNDALRFSNAKVKF